MRCLFSLKHGLVWIEYRDRPNRSIREAEQVGVGKREACACARAMAERLTGQSTGPRSNRH